MESLTDITSPRRVMTSRNNSSGITSVHQDRNRPPSDTTIYWQIDGHSTPATDWRLSCAHIRDAISHRNAHVSLHSDSLNIRLSNLTARKVMHQPFNVTPRKNQRLSGSFSPNVVWPNCCHLLRSTFSKPIFIKMTLQYQHKRYTVRVPALQCLTWWITIISL